MPDAITHYDPPVSILTMSSAGKEAAFPEALYLFTETIVKNGVETDRVVRASTTAPDPQALAQAVINHPAASQIDQMRVCIQKMPALAQAIGCTVAREEFGLNDGP